MKREITNIDKYLNTLIKLADLFNHHSFKWSLGASMMLKLRGFNVTVNDIDIILKTKEIERLEEVLSKFNFKKELHSTKYPTTHFYELLVDNVEVDIMIGFKVKTDDGIYTFDDESEVEEINIHGTSVYLSSLEEWLKTYKAMKRNEKVSIIEKTFTNK